LVQATQGKALMAVWEITLVMATAEVEVEVHLRLVETVQVRLLAQAVQVPHHQ
jgi:hypothetical protein